MDYQTTIPDLQPWVLKFISDSEDGIVKQLPGVLKGFEMIRQRLPAEYRWKLMEDEAFEKQAIKGGDHVNQVYWYHMARQIEAFDVLAVLRSHELLIGAVSLVNSKQVLAPAVLARSLLEIAVTYLVDGNYIDKTLKDGLPQVQAGQMAACEDLEKRLIKMVHGRRIGDPPKELEKTNILTHLKFLSRNPKCSELNDRYSYLCEIAHPNVVGFARFWGEAVEGQAEDDFTTITVRGDTEVPLTAHIREQTLWALSWSAEAIGNMFFMGQDSVRAIVEKFGVPPSEMQR